MAKEKEIELMKQNLKVRFVSTAHIMWGRDIPELTSHEIYETIAATVKQYIAENWIKTNRAYMERLRDHWLTSHDWAATVARLNGFPHVRVEVEPGFRLHALHLRSSRADAKPLLIAHGWPGSIIEFETIYRRLAEPGFRIVDQEYDDLSTAAAGH